MMTSPRAALTRSKRLSSSSMCAAGSCAKAPLLKVLRENAPVMRRASLRTARPITEPSPEPPATWSQVARISSTSSSTESRSTSVIALLRPMRGFWRLSAWRVSSLPPTTTRVPPPSYASSSSPWIRKTDCAPFIRSFSGSLPRAPRSTTATWASSARRSGDRLASGVSVASCSGVARAVWAFMLELEDQIVLQHARLERARALLDLEHGRLDLAGLHVRDVDLGVALELRQLLGEHRRAQVARNLGELAFLVGERGLDDEVLEVLNAVDDLPQCFVRAGIAGEHQARGAAVEVITAARHPVPCRDRAHPPPPKLHPAADLALLVAQERRCPRGSLGESEPDR